MWSNKVYYTIKKSFMSMKNIHKLKYRKLSINALSPNNNSNNNSAVFIFLLVIGLYISQPPKPPISKIQIYKICDDKTSSDMIKL